MIRATYTHTHVVIEAGVNMDPDPVDDQLFEPTVDMMVNDFDDEQTLEEEENMAGTYIIPEITILG